MKKRVLSIVCLLTLTIGVQETAFSSPESFRQYYENAQNYLTQGQYSTAIVEFRKALKVNFMDNSARVGLINSYFARATYYANQERNFEKAANDFRSALFYLRIFPTKDQTIQNSASMIASANENLNQCLNVISFDKTAYSRYKKAEELKSNGNFSAAIYEFSQAAQNEKLSFDSYVQMGDLLKTLGNEIRSADYYKLALDLKPQDGLLRMKYARTLDKIGKFDDAVAQYNEALAHSKGDMEVLFALERIYSMKLAKTPSDAELNANLGAIKQAQGDFDTALSYYAKAEQINPSNVTTRLNVGTLFQQKKDYARAIKSYDSILALYPDNVQANLYKAQVLSEIGNKKEAMNLYKKVLSLDPANTIAKSEIANVMESVMSPSDYISYLAQKSSSDKSMQATLYDYAYKLHKENKISEAIDGYKSLIEVNPTNVDAYVNLAICYAAQNDYNNAQSILKTAKEKFPTNNLVLKTYNDVLKDSASIILSDAAKSFENKDFNTALQKYLSINPATESSLLGVAASYQSLENYDKAIEYYKKAENIAPKNAEIPYYIGYLYSEQQNWVESEKYLKKSISLNPESEAKNLLSYVMQNFTLAELDNGINFFEKKDFESALVKLNEVVKRDSKSAFAYYYRGLIYDEQKKYNLAVDDYNKFLSVYSTNDEYLQYIKTRIEELKPFLGT